jgi:hypothetical protein
MPSLLFADLDLLRHALERGSVPPDVARAPVRAGFDDQGRLRLEPDAALTRATLAGLADLGVQIRNDSPVVPDEWAFCWAALLPLVPAPIRTADRIGPVMFDVAPDRLVRFAARLRRGRKQRFALRPTDEGTRTLLLASSQPFDARANDADPRGFVEVEPRVWVAVGWRHPFPGLLRPPDGQIALASPPNAWRFLPDAPFRPEVEEFALPAAAASRSPKRGGGEQDDSPDRLTIPLRLEPNRSAPAETPELWVLDDDPIEQLRHLATTLDEAILARLAFAVGAADDDAGGERFIVLRVQPAKGPPPVLVLPAPGYAPYLKLPNLFVPAGSRLRPAPRRDVLRDRLVPDPRRVTWLRAAEAGRFRVESVAEAAFQPLLGRVEYRRPRPHRLAAWDEPACFPLAKFTVRPDPVAAPRREPVREDEPDVASASPGWFARLAGLFRRRPVPEPSPAPTAEPPTPQPDVAEAFPLVTVVEESERPAPARTKRPNAWQERRQALERRLLDSREPPTADERLKVWPDLASLYASQNNNADASICWLNALWEDEKPAALWAWGWLRAEAFTTRKPSPDADLDRWLGAEPSPPVVRSLAACAVWAAVQDPTPAGLADRLNPLRERLEQYEDWLPVRAAWLAQLHLARLAGGDVLGLARTRDRLLERLARRGLSLDQDLPTFLRFAGPDAGERYPSVRDWLLRAREPVQRWVAKLPTGGPRAFAGLQEFGLDAEKHFTAAYADLILAYGLARLGEYGSCSELTARAADVLTAPADPVHEFLLAAFRHRIDQAVSGKPGRGPLPPELLDRLGALRGDDWAYKAGVLRGRSRILEPAGSVDVYRCPAAVHRSGVGELDRALLALPDLADPDELARQVRHLLSSATRDGPSATLPFVVAHALEAAPRSGDRLAAEVLRHAPAALGLAGDRLPLQAYLLEKAVSAAERLDQPDSMRELVKHAMRLMEGEAGPGRVAAFEGLARQCSRGLRRLGLREELDALLRRTANWVLQGYTPSGLRSKWPESWPAALRTLLHVAAGWFYTGRDDSASEILEAAREQLYRGDQPPAEQTALALSFVAALGQAPVKSALVRLGELFQGFTAVAVTGWTNTHYALKPLELIEAVVLAVVSEDFALGPTARRWLDDEEFLVRRRIHRDTETLLRRDAGG